MKDKDKFLTTTAVATAIFVNPFAVVCSVAAYATWKFLDAEKARKEEICGENTPEPEEYEEKEEEEPMDTTDKVEDPTDDTPLSSTLTDDEIEDILRA